MKKILLLFYGFVTIGLSAQAGMLDTTFSNTGTGLSGNADDIIVQPDGKILVSGYYFASYNNVSRNRIARLNANGSLDTSFDPGFGANASIYDMALQSNGKILIAGNFTTYNGTAINRVARINADGTLDTTFNPGAGPGNVVYSLVLQPDGKILIGGNFVTFGSAVRRYIAKLNADGSLDSSFDTGTGANGSIDNMVLQPDGKVIVTSYGFTTYNGISRKRIARLNADGTLDVSFDPGNGADADIYAVALQPDGKILIGGQFKNYNNITANRIARLQANGSLDATFNQGTGADWHISDIVLQADGKILAGGNLTTYNGTARKYFARLNAGGTLDTTFNTGSGPNDVIASIAVQPDSKILISGNFSSYNATNRSRIARISAGTLSAQDVDKHNMIIYPNPVKDILQIWNKTRNVESAVVFDMSGRKVLTTKEVTKVNMSKLPKGNYILILYDGKGIQLLSSQFIKD
ncbi:T9SS type A sorting domain-containing protein [Epilithonimonas sp. JDS]|uniref:T9SS type A sorting domain-containing protein n=1 Tax=Epilithonimonas sp. JDS TaxID=2902797 RepID=UPI001E33FC58|nr:T9SS type A sorting domain-containing protein [Epilithonimonas sp. JDS]MCD9854806.1 T9SS type A sorting domain-containing protein [Epilithonimonas sp. JDS]